MKTCFNYRTVVALCFWLMSLSVSTADDGVELSLKAGERRDYRIQFEDTTTSAGGGVNVKDTYPMTLDVSLVTEPPTDKELIPVVLTVKRYQAKLPQLDSDFVKRLYEFDSAKSQAGGRLPNIYFAYYAAHLAVPIKLMFNKSGELVEVLGTTELSAELERILNRDFSAEPSLPNSLQAGRIRCHKDTLKRLWENLLSLKFPEDFEPEKEWKTKVVFAIPGSYVCWLNGKHTTVEGENNGFTVTSEYEFPRSQPQIQKNASGSENEYFIKSGTGKGTMLRGADGWPTKHTRELHLYMSITLRFSGAEIPSERYSKFVHTIERTSK